MLATVVKIKRPSKFLSAEEECALARRWSVHKDKRALARLITTNLLLVPQVAHQVGMGDKITDDLLQDGTTGLIIAAQKFDPDRGVRFTSYAALWIRAYIFNHTFTLYGPVRIGTTKNQRKVIQGMSRARRKLWHSGLDETPANLARVLDVPVEAVEVLLPRMSHGDLFLDALLPDGDVHEGLADPDAVDSELASIESEAQDRLRSDIAGVLKELDPRSRMIIKERHLSEEPMGLRALGEKLGLSPERVRQIESKALGKIKEALG